MTTGIWIFLIILFTIGGGVAGFFIARATFKSYVEKNPPIDEKTIRVMYSQMGVTPSQKKVNQVLAQMKQSSAKASDKKKKKQPQGTKKTLSGKKVTK